MRHAVRRGTILHVQRPMTAPSHRRGAAHVCLYARPIVHSCTSFCCVIKSRLREDEKQVYSHVCVYHSFRLITLSRGWNPLAEIISHFAAAAASLSAAHGEMLTFASRSIEKPPVEEEPPAAFESCSICLCAATAVMQALSIVVCGCIKKQDVIYNKCTMPQHRSSQLSSSRSCSSTRYGGRRRR